MVADETAQLRRRSQRYRRGRDPLPLIGRTVILVDDGLATGATARVAIEVVRQRGTAEVVLAAPVAPASTVIALRRAADAVVCLHPRWFGSVGNFYDDFSQTTDEEVARLLDQAAKRADGTRSRGCSGWLCLAHAPRSTRAPSSSVRDAAASGCSVARLAAARQSARVI